LAAQELSELGDREVDPTGSGKEEDHGVETKGIDIWRDATCLALLKEGMLPDIIDLEEGKMARKRANNYAGRSRGSTSRNCMCPSLRKEYHWWFRCMRIWGTLENKGCWLKSVEGISGTVELRMSSR